MAYIKAIKATVSCETKRKHIHIQRWEKSTRPSKKHNNHHQQHLSAENFILRCLFLYNTENGHIIILHICLNPIFSFLAGVDSPFFHQFALTNIILWMHKINNNDNDDTVRATEFSIFEICA